VPLLKNEVSELGQRRAAAERAKARAAVAEAALAAGDPALASQAQADAIEADPADDALRRRLVEIHAEQILREPASVTSANALRLHAELTAALAGAPKAPARLQIALGKVLQLRGRDDGARKAFESAVQAEPGLAIAHMHLGDLLLKARQYEGAATALEKALSLDASLHEARFALGQTRLAQEKYEEAGKLLTEAVEHLDRGPVRLALGRALLHQKKWADASKSLERALALQPDLAAAHAPLAEAWLRQGQNDLALGALEAAWRLTGDAEALARRAELLQGLGRHQEAVAAWGELRRLLPNDARAPLGVARSALALGQADAARGALEAAVRLAQADERQAAQLQEAQSRLAALAAAPAAPKR
jgi:tetratricopeptide (TPR) repeat protein